LRLRPGISTTIRASIAGTIVLLASVVPAFAADGDLHERALQSWTSGTGGEAAMEALCNLQAVVEFYDGHHTPELIEDDLLLWHLGVFRSPFMAARPPPRPNGLSPEGSALVAKVLERLNVEGRSLWERNKQRAKSLAGLSENEAHEIRRVINDDVNQTRQDTRTLAGRLLLALRKEQSKDDLAIFESWFDARRHDSVILVQDPSKMIRYDARECDDYLPPQRH
jgi:hypothetical protein